MINDQNAAVAAAKMEAEAKAAFDRFMSRNETKLMFSMIPPTEPRELLATLIRSAFDAGVSNGFSSSMSMMCDEMLRSFKAGQ